VIPEFTMRVLIWLVTVVAVVSVEAWSRKLTMLVEPVAVPVVVGVPIVLAPVPAWLTRLVSSVLSAVPSTGVVAPVGSVTVRVRAPVGGGGGGEQQSAATSTAPVTEPVQANVLGPPVKPTRDRVLPQMMPALVTRVLMVVVRKAAVVSTGVWPSKIS
jgi:hypothetical protein